MRALFWRRKNARLATRLTTLVESSERLRKERRRKPRRVVIDTSYIEQAASEADWVDAEQGTEAASNANAPMGSMHDADAERGSYAEVDGGPDLYEDDGFVAVDEADDETSAILREAIEQLDRAEAGEAEALEREAAAVAQVEAQREQLEQLEADLAQERRARNDVEQELEALSGRDGPSDDVTRQGEDQAAAVASIERELAAQRERADTIAADLEQERQNCRQAVAECAKAIDRADAAERKQADLAKVEADYDAAVERAEAAEAEAARSAEDVEKERERADHLERDIVSEQNARAEAEAASDAADQQVAELEKRLADEKRMTQSRVDELEARAEDAETRAAAAEAQADEQAGVAARLETELADLGSTLADLRASEAAGAERVEQAELELTKLRALTDELHVAKQRIADAQARDDAARGEAKAQAKSIRRLDSEIKTLRDALEQAETEIEAATQRADTAERELADLTATDAAIHATADEQGAARSAGDEQAIKDVEDRCSALTLELEEMRIALANAEAANEAAVERADAGEREIAELRESEAIRGEMAQRCEAAEQRATEAQAEVDAVRKQLAEIEAERDREDGTGEGLPKGSAAEQDERPQTARQPKDAETETRKAQNDSAAEAKHDAAEPAAKAKSQPSKARATKEKAKVTKPAPKRAQRISTKKAEEVSDTTESSVAKSRVKNVVQKRIAKATAQKPKSDEGRRARRVTSRKLASLWQEGMSAPLSCTILDRSSTGAKIEVLTDRFNTSMNDFAVGDRFTVTQTFAHERTSVLGEIIWVDGQQCGVRYCGQILTEVQKPAKKKKAAAKSTEKPSAGKSIKSLFSVGAR